MRIVIASLVLSLLVLGACAEPPSELLQTTSRAGVEEVVRWFEGHDLHVVTFIGYSGAGYEDEDAMLAAARAELEKHDPTKTLVNIGATPDGIGAVYALARELGFRTAGIVSTQGWDYRETITLDVQRVFFVEDATWGGYGEGSTTLSPTSEAMVRVSDEIVGIGGGAVGRDEMLEARKRGKPVRFIPADMNHAKAVAKAKRKGKPVPTDFHGAAAAALMPR